MRVKFTSRWYPVLLKCFKVVCNLNTLSVYMKTACLLVDTNAFFSRWWHLSSAFAWLTHNLREMSLTLEVKIRSHADHPRTASTNMYLTSLILINYFRLLSDVTNFFLILCFANDNIDKIKSNHNLNTFINVIFIIIFFVFLFQINNLCIVILRDINDSSQSSLALAGLAMKIDSGIQNN